MGREANDCTPVFRLIRSFLSYLPSTPCQHSEPPDQSNVCRLSLPSAFLGEPRQFLLPDDRCCPQCEEQEVMLWRTTRSQQRFFSRSSSVPCTGAHGCGRFEDLGMEKVGPQCELGDWLGPQCTNGNAVCPCIEALAACIATCNNKQTCSWSSKIEEFELRVAFQRLSRVVFDRADHGPGSPRALPLLCCGDPK